MEWFETDELALVISTVRDICEQEIEGKVVDLESLGKPGFPAEAIDTFTDLGFLWGPAPEDIGSGMDDITTVVMLAELARACAGFAAIVSCHYAALRSILSLTGGQAVLESLCGGNGSAAARPPLLGVALERDVSPRGASPERRYVVMPSSANVPLVLLFSGEGTTRRMVLAGGAELSERAEAIPLSGCDEMPAAKVTLPPGTLEGMRETATGTEADLARDVMASSLKLYFSAVLQGAARSATAYALEYAQQRRQTGRAIIHHQNMRKKLVEMEIKNQSMASFLYRAALSGTDKDGFGLADMLFAFLQGESEYVVNEAVQCLGGYGYMRDYGLEKKLRDVKALQALLATPLGDWLGVRV
jgi:alkylation response protein AidB-like acyl-CoA dehydrogenase